MARRAISANVRDDIGSALANFPQVDSATTEHHARGTRVTMTGRSTRVLREILSNVASEFDLSVDSVNTLDRTLIATLSDATVAP